MLGKTGTETQRSDSSFKENTISMSCNNDNQSVISILKRHEKAISEMQRQMKKKVNKNDLLTGLGSKVSLSDITNITLDLNSEESIRINQSNSTLIHSIEEEINFKLKENAQKMRKMSKDCQQRLNAVQEQLQTKQYQTFEEINKLRSSLKESEKDLRQTLQKKGQRSEFDKVLNLASLLAIEFQLIKKRFASFESGSHEIWKEIANIYSAQEDIKNKIQLQQNNQKKKEIENQTASKTLQRCLFDSIEKTTCNQQEVDVKAQLQKLTKGVQVLQSKQQDNSFTFRLFTERLAVVQNYHQKWFKSLKQIQRTKKDLATTTTDLEQLYKVNLRLKEECVSLIDQSVSSQVKKQSGAIKMEIHQACQELTCRMLKFFDKCAKAEQLVQVSDSIQGLQEYCNQKIRNVTSVVKKNHQQACSKSNLLDEKIRIQQQDIDTRLLRDQFKEQRSRLITSADAVSLIKKTENSLKTSLQVFSTQQKQVNQVLCSQNVLMRWVWTSGVLKGGNLIHWDREVINTLPQNFCYCKQEQVFKVISGGIYRLQLGFYAKKKPNIQIIVNGQTIISAVNSNSYVVHHSSGRLKDISTSQVSGLTYYDFFTFQDNSRIAIAYTGELGHGFIGLHRL